MDYSNGVMTLCYGTRTLRGLRLLKNDGQKIANSTIAVLRGDSGNARNGRSVRGL